MIKASRFLRTVTLFSILFCTQLIAQTHTPYVDSLMSELKVSKDDTNKVKILNELCWEFLYIDIDDAIDFGKASTLLSKKLNYLDGQSVAHYYLGGHYNKKGETELAISEINKALKIDKKIGNRRAIATDHGELASSYKSLGNLDKAAYHYYKSLEILEEVGNSYGAAQIKLNIANFNLQRNEFKQAIPLIREAKKEFISVGDSVMIANAISAEAIAFTRLKNWDTSFALYMQALKIYQKANFKFGEAEVLNNIGTHFHEKEDLDKALYYLEKSLALDDSLGRAINQSISHANIALVYLDRGDNEKSIDHIDQSIALGKEVGELREIMSLMKYAGEIYYTNGDYKKAYDYFLISDQIKDTLVAEKKTEQILDIQEKYETEKKAKKIIILKKERDASRSKSQLVDTVIYFSIGTIILLIVIVAFFFRQRKAKDNQRKIELEQKVLRAQMNPHFIFNSLNSIQRIFIEGDEDLANDYISDFGKLLRIIMENNGKDYVSIKNEVETLKLYLDIEMIRLDGKIDYTFDIDPNLEMLNNFIPPLIIQPFVENAIWHGILPMENEEKGEILIKIGKESEKFIKCSIVDNGIGITQSLAMKTNHSHNSKGMSITQERLMNKIQIKDVDSGGTEVTLLIPLNP